MDFLRDNFVCLVLDGYIADGYGRSGHHCPEDAAWYGKSKIGSNTWTFVSAGGTLLGGLHDARKVLEDFRQLPEPDRKPAVTEEPAPEKGIAHLRPPAGGLVLRAYSTPLERAADGTLARAGRVFTDCYATSAGCVEPGLTQVDMLWMREAEWRSLIPEEPKKGQSFRLPAVLERRMIENVVPCANPIGDRGELTLTVTDVSPEAVRLRLDGISRQGPSFKECQAAFAKERPDGKPGTAPNGQATRWLGSIVYDAKKKAVTEFNVVAIGHAWGETFNRKHGAGARAEPRRWVTGYAFELAGNGPADRITPPKVVGNAPYNGGLAERYWGK